MEPIDRALDASLTQRQGLRSIPYCAAHKTRAYLPRALRWLKLREFSEAANAVGLALAPLEPRLAVLACAGPDPCDGGEGRSASRRLRALAHEKLARHNAEDALYGRAKARGARREPMS